MDMQRWLWPLLVIAARTWSHSCSMPWRCPRCPLGTPLANAIKGFGDVPDDAPRHHACRKIVHMLLRAGAQIGRSIDEAFEQTEDRCFRP